MQPLQTLGRIRPSLPQRLTRLRNRHFLGLDMAALCVTPLIALFLLVDGDRDIGPFVRSMAVYTIGAGLIRLSSFYGLGLYRRYWRSATAEDLVQLVAATSLSTVLASLMLAGMAWSGAFSPVLPRFLPVVDGILTLCVIGSYRFGVRLAGRRGMATPSEDAKPTLIIGAGLVGERIVREVRNSDRLDIRLVGFLDDDPMKHGLRIQGLPVLGSRQELPSIVCERGISQVIIALPSVAGRVIRQTLALCEEAGVEAKTVPSLAEILAGRGRVSELRKVDIEDVLRREPIETNIDAVRKFVEGKRVLVTGAGGSIGSELCRQVFACRPAELALLGHGENSIFEIHNELKAAPFSVAPPNGRPVLKPIIADIRSAVRLRRVVQEFKPDIILHAAAHKHVPLMQENPTEAASNNVLGTKNLLDAAVEYGVDHLVMISTDKVVNPTSAMGASKRAAEMLVLQAAQRTGKNYVAVRFGNVLGSRGSVVPIFKQQIAAGGPVTVSHPGMTRYFITIPEAVQLVLQAAVLGQGGEIFMLDMGEPVAIVDLAKDLIELSGLEVGRDIDIVFTGIRPGEKLSEELFVRGEVYEPTEHRKIRMVLNACHFVSACLDEGLIALTAAVDADDREAAVAALKTLVPAFNPGGGAARADLSRAAVAVAGEARRIVDGALTQAAAG